MQYRKQWLIHKFDVTKTYFEKIVKDKRTYTSFDRFIYDEVLYKSRTFLIAFFFQSISKRRIKKISNPDNF